MNKYQEAWYQITRSFYEHMWFEPEEVEILQELVDRATPRHANSEGECVICDYFISWDSELLDFCPNCGQALEWGE